VTVRILSEPFDAGEELNQFTARQSGAGAIVSFSGIVRDVAGALDHMEIEHYPAMTEKAIAEIRHEAVERWSLQDAMVIHRHGKLRAEDPIMMVLAAARHRKDAFAAAEFMMDYLKSRAPFWKKEVSGAGSEWVDAKEEDEGALGRWSAN